MVELYNNNKRLYVSIFNNKKYFCSDIMMINSVHKFYRVVGNI